MQKISNLAKSRILTLNQPQWRSWQVEANVEYDVWARGTGKTTGRIAPRVHKTVQAMPRSLNIFGAATYSQLLTRTLPPVLTALEKMGYIRDVHYTFGKKPPNAWKWDLPYVSPLSWDYTMCFANGAAYQLVSQDRPGSANGISADTGIFDEAKYLDMARFNEEIIPIFRGNLEEFGQHELHYSLLFCTDMPTTPKAQWILEKEKEMDPRRIELILNAVKQLNDLQARLAKTTSNSYKERLQKQIAHFSRALTLLRKGAVYYSEANALDNIHVLGKDYLRRMKRLLPPIIYNTSILNKRMRKLDKLFYAAFVEDKHTYQAKENEYLLNLDYKFEKNEQGFYMPGTDSSIIDADLLPDEPISVAVDYGGHFNCLVAGQEGVQYGQRVFRVLKDLFVCQPERLQELADKFTTYYRHHRHKVVEFYYDHTAIGNNPTGILWKDIFANALRDKGWHVIECYFGRAPSHQDKIDFWHKCFLGLDPSLPFVLFNRDNCEHTITSMMDAGIRVGRDGKFEKDKRSEQDDNVAPEDATHLSDALDMLLYYKYRQEYVQEEGLPATQIL